MKYEGNGHSLSAGVNVRGSYTAQEFEPQKGVEKKTMSWFSFWFRILVAAGLVGCVGGWWALFHYFGAIKVLSCAALTMAAALAWPYVNGSNS